MEEITITMPLAAYLDLKNTVTWAALWDMERNNNKNRVVYDCFLPYVLDAGPDGTPSADERAAATR